MKLRSLWISGFKSFKEKDLSKHEQPFIVDSKVTVLIGANDHGKSNVLEAIQRLNDDSPMVEDDRNWDLEEKKNPRIEWSFFVDDTEIEKLKAEAKKAEDAAIAAEKAQQAAAAPVMATTESIAEPAVAITDVAKAVTEAAAKVAAPVVVKPTPTYLPTSVNKNEIVYSREGVGSPVRVLAAPFKIDAAFEKVLLDARPRVELFEVPPQANVIDLLKKAQLTDPKDPKYEFVKGLFLSAGIWDMRDDLFGNDLKSSRQIETASKKLTEVMVKTWGQGDGLEWKLKQKGNNGDTLAIELGDPSVNSQNVRPSQKSSGFRTFFLLSMAIKSRTFDSKDKPHIFLFDEPGTYLHPKAQIDLQRSFEIISDTAQICYTTHSLFLISKNHPGRNRVISKTINGTLVDQKPFIGNWKAVRDSLGIVMSNNFLIADKSLLLEGPSDHFYVVDAIKKLKEDGINIDLNDFSTVDGGDTENYVAMAKLMAEEGRFVFCLADGDDAGKEKINEVKKTCEDEMNATKEHEVKVDADQLPANKSTEDIFADPVMLNTAVLNVANNLIKMGARKLNTGVNLVVEIKKIIPNEKETFGAIIDRETATWFDPKTTPQNKSISKLSIALEYDRLAQEALTKELEFKPPAVAKKLIQELQKRMQLKDERSAESGVMGIVS